MQQLGVEDEFLFEYIGTWFTEEADPETLAEIESHRLEMVEQGLPQCLSTVETK